VKVTHQLTDESFQDFVNLASGLFAPLRGFMTGTQYRGVVDRMKLGEHAWTIPITLDVDAVTYERARSASRLYLSYRGAEAGYMQVEDCYQVDAPADAGKIFGTAEQKHPGVAHEGCRSPMRVGGEVKVTLRSVIDDAIIPERIRDLFAARKWRTVAAFHTRNPVHRAHEHLHRLALEVCDGLFLSPFLGWKKAGDFGDEAIMQAYRVMVDTYYPRDRVHLEGLRSSMRYAGPREAVLHAIMRRNLGCTHFIVGRDHAGVGSYYGKYEAQELASQLAGEDALGIQLILPSEPYYCRKCAQVVTARHCGHSGDDIVEVSGTTIRETIRQGKRPDERFLRPEVADVLLGLGRKAFVD